MADISKIDNGTEYNLKDATARAGIESSKTLKSSVVTVPDAAPINAEDITVDITPIQDLHGYDRPWAGGAWKNKLPMTVAGVKAANTSGTWNGNIYSINGGTIEVLVDNADNVLGFKVNGTFTPYIWDFIIGEVPIQNNIRLVGCPSNGDFENKFALYVFDWGARFWDDGEGVNFNNAATNATVRLVIRDNIQMANEILKPMITTDLTATYTDFAPYSNICPLEGRTGAELTQKDAATNPTVTRIYSTDFGGTVYGGKWHVTEGGTDKTHSNIASYNGETINEPWLSSLDEYSPGATPTTGAQVVYPLTTPTTISTPKQNVPMLKGINTASADCGDTQLKYQPDNVVGELKGEIQVANSFVAKMALRQGSGAKDFSYGGWSFRIRIFRSMGQISLYVENISASNVTEQAIVKVFMDTSDYRAPEELRPNFNLLQAATYTTPSGWAIQVYLKDDGYIMFTGIAPEVGASAPTSSNWNLVEPWATHQQAKDLFNN